MTLPLEATRKFIHVSYRTVCTAPWPPCRSTPTHSMHPTSFTTYRPPWPAMHDNACHSADMALCWPPPSPPVAALKSVPTSPTPKRSPAPNLKSMTPEERTAFIRANAQRCVQERMRAPGVASRLHQKPRLWHRHPLSRPLILHLHHPRLCLSK